jgi:two-component system, chemotaxis family, protein-glutamate methylesterase/glutaminase
MKERLSILIASGNKHELEALEKLISHAPGFRVAGGAANDLGLIELIVAAAPDVVLIDVDTFSDDPVFLIRLIMRQAPTPILLLSSEQKALKAVEGIAAGALTVIKRPGIIDLQSGRPPAETLLKMLKTYASIQVIRHVHGGEPRAKTPTKSVGQSSGVVVIASSTGGPNSLKTVLGALPANLPTGVVVAQHITQGFTQGLVQWLDKITPLHVKLAENGETIQPGTVYFAPDEFHITVEKDGTIGLDKAAATDGHRPSCNRLLHSAAVAYGNRATGVILSGMGDDGARGLLEIKQIGGQTFAQDEATCVVFGMPRVAVEIGAVPRTTALASIGAEIVRSLT